MPEEIVYSEQVHPTVAQYITAHGGQVQTERVPPEWVFQKVILAVKAARRVGGGDLSPIYLYILEDGGRLLVQTNRSRGDVPGHPYDYWMSLYVEM